MKYFNKIKSSQEIFYSQNKTLLFQLKSYMIFPKYKFLQLTSFFKSKSELPSNISSKYSIYMKDTNYDNILSSEIMQFKVSLNTFSKEGLKESMININEILNSDRKRYFRYYFLSHLFNSELLFLNDDIQGCIAELNKAYSFSLIINGTNSPYTLLILLRMIDKLNKIQETFFASGLSVLVFSIVNNNIFNKRLNMLHEESINNQVVKELLLLSLDYNFNNLNNSLRLYSEDHNTINITSLDCLAKLINKELEFFFKCNIIKDLKDKEITLKYLMSYADIIAYTKLYKCNYLQIIINYYISFNQNLEESVISEVQSIIELLMKDKDIDAYTVIPSFIYLIKHYSFKNETSKMKIILDGYLKYLDRLTKENEEAYYYFIIEAYKEIDSSDSFKDFLYSSLKKCESYFEKNIEKNEFKIAEIQLLLFNVAKSDTEEISLFKKYSHLMKKKVGRKSEAYLRSLVMIENNKN